MTRPSPSATSSASSAPRRPACRRGERSPGPRWEFAEAPRLATGLLKRIDAFAAVALRPDATAQDYRLARKALIEAIAALSDSAARMGGEPAAAQRGLEELAAMLIAAHGVVAQLSAARIALQAADPAEADQARVEAAAAQRWLSGELAAGGAPAAEATIDRAAPFSALKRATRRLSRPPKPIVAPRRRHDARLPSPVRERGRGEGPQVGRLAAKSRRGVSCRVSRLVSGLPGGKFPLRHLRAPAWPTAVRAPAVRCGAATRAPARRRSRRGRSRDSGRVRRRA